MANSKKPGEAQEPKGSTNNVTDPAKENLIKDDFFKDLTDIDDGFNLDFTGISTDNSKNIQDVVSDSSIKLDPPKESKPEANKDEKIKTTVLKPAATVNKKKEIEMTNKRLESLGLNPDDPASKQFAEIWEHMNTTDASEFKLQVLRLEPAAIKGVKISGYLTTFHLPTTIPDIVEQVGQKYGGGRYQIRIVNGAGKYVKSKTFDIAGLPKIPGEEESKVEPEKETKPADTSSNDDWDDDDDDDLDLRPRRPSLRPRPHMGGFGGMGGMDPDFPPFQQPTFGGRGSFGRRHDPSEDVKREFEDKLRRVEDQIDSKFDKLTNLIAMQNSQPKNSGLFSPEMFQHIAPVVGAYLESNRTRESSSVKQAAEMNQQMANLMQGMQDLVRLSDKSKEDLSEKERADREAYRREMMEQQNRMQMQMLQQQQQQEERFQKMMLAMKESFESQRSNENTLESKLRMDFESQREAARERELKLMMEAREREAQLREEARRREDESRQRDFNMREQIRLEQIKFQEEMRRRDEEARQREIDRLEQMRIKEIQAVTEQKTRELEVQERIRAMDSQKVEMQHKLLEQFYTNNIGQRDSQLQLEMAIAKLSSDNEQKHLTQLSQMELEKMKHQTQMQMLKMKHDLSTLESNKQVEDPMDTALKDYLKRRMQIDMIKELGADYDDEDIPGNSISSILKNLVKEGAGAVAPVLNQILAGGMAPSMPAPRPQVGRVVNPSPAPTPAQPTDVGAETTEDGVEAYVTDESEHVEDMDVDTEGAEGEVYEEEQDYVDESYAFDPMQEIPRVAEFFEYLKVSIDNNSATPQEAAIVLQQSLAPPLVEYITGITDSYAIIEELYPLLTGYNPDFGPYFTQQHVLDWMTLMLRALNGEDVAPTPEPEAKAEPEPTPEPTPEPEVKAEPEPTPEPTPEPEVKAEPEPKAEAEKPKPKTKKKTTKKTTKKSRTRKTSTKKEEVSKS